MVEHKVCKDCKWNNYPICLGTKMSDGNYMNIENLRAGFNCGQKDDAVMDDFSIVEKTVEELKLEDLEVRILELEEKTITEK